MAGQLRCVVVFVSVAALACSGAGDAENEDESDRHEGYGPELKADFVADCTDAGTPEATCACLYDALEADVSYERFQEIDEDLRSGPTGVPADIPTDIQSMAVACAAEPSD